MKIRSSSASSISSSATALGQHHSVGLEIPVTPHRSSPWPSTAWEGEKDSSAHDAAAPRSIPFQDPTLLPKGWARPCPTCSCWRVGNTWLLEVAAAVCPPVMTHGCWEKDGVSGSDCNTLPVGEGPRLVSLPWHRRARLCRKLPCSPPKLSDPQTAPSP